MVEFRWARVQRSLFDVLQLQPVSVFVVDFTISACCSILPRCSIISPMPVRLNQTDAFPDPNLADREGLVAIGGDLGMDRLLAAYRAGLFPWTADPVSWWSPDPRGIIELEAFHVPRSLARVISRGDFTVTRDKAFREVITACAEPRSDRPGAWLSEALIHAYIHLHKQGHAHSVECWRDGMLVGGIYGVAVGGLFAGESMFHKETNASKVALFHLVEHLKNRGYALFDIQMVTKATIPLGAIEISRTEYLQRLAKAVSKECSF
jgi:leucyl/phenylalanyl-tRNA--protein transferase